MATFVALCAGCGPGNVRLVPAKACDGGNLRDCRARCRQNEARACYRLGWFYEEGEGGLPRNVGGAIKLYDQACAAGMAVACRALGMIYARGDDGVRRNGPRALQYYEKACSLGLDEACLDDKEKGRLARKPGSSGKSKGDANASGSVSVGVGTGD